MIRFPVCGKENEALLCPLCGYDARLNYECHPTLSTLPGETAAVSAHIRRRESLILCRRCGSELFRMSKDGVLRCGVCGTDAKTGFAPTRSASLKRPSFAPRCDTPLAAGPDHALGLLRNGTVVAAGTTGVGECAVWDWKNILAITAGRKYTIGLRKDGSVLMTGRKFPDVKSWQLN